VSLKVRVLSELHHGVYSVSGGRIGRRIAGMPVLLLTTDGRRSGRPRTVPLTYFEDGDSIVLVASYGGRPRNPAWFENLLANPEVEVRIARERRRMRARRATSEERARLWPRVVATYDGYRVYQEKTDREIPLAVLEE
jgi:deazaflavin-dependent oxidoreductase (nitroreductase family)